MRLLGLWGGVALVATLSACTEQPQVAGQRFVGTPPSAGTGAATYTDPGWKVGDATSWEEHLRTRTQSGQNEYLRSSGK